MKIQIGKKYIDGYGDIIEIISTTTNDNYKFLSKYRISYTEEGVFDIRNKSSRHNLICEINETLYVEYKQDLITKYNFFLKHYILYGGNPEWIKNKTSMK